MFIPSFHHSKAPLTITQPDMSRFSGLRKYFWKASSPTQRRPPACRRSSLRAFISLPPPYRSFSHDYFAIRQNVPRYSPRNCKRYPRWMGYEDQANYYLSRIALSKSINSLPIIYVTSGNATSVKDFNVEVQPKSVVVKKELLFGNDLNSLTWV